MGVCRNIYARSRNHSCLGKAISMKYEEWMPVFLPYVPEM